jgi:hypothetical protein
MIALEAGAGCWAKTPDVPMSNAHPVNTHLRQRFMR